MVMPWATTASRKTLSVYAKAENVTIIGETGNYTDEQVPPLTYLPRVTYKGSSLSPYVTKEDGFISDGHNDMDEDSEDSESETLHPKKRAKMSR
jgi:hypothetical protein